MQRDKNTFDATYAARYVERNAEKVSRIISRLENPASVLDLGCNAGYVDAAALAAFPRATCHGVELEASVVDKELLANPRFALTVSDVVDFRFDRTYDAVIFNAVLHHVLGKYGKEVALDLWTRIVDHTNRELFFETGIAAEAGEYYWKDAILREFGGDEFYYSELIRRIGPRLARMDVVAELPIHDAVRLLHRFELHPLGSEFDSKAAPNQVYADGFWDDSQLELLQEYRRTEGSRRQRLIPLSEAGAGESSHVFRGTSFYELRDKSSGDMLFAKRMVSDPYKQMREYLIHTQVAHPRIEACLGVSARYGLVFRKAAGVPLDEIDWSAIRNRERIAAEIDAFFAECAELTFQPGRFDLDPLTSGAARSLLDTVDLHKHNFLCHQVGAEVVAWSFVDLEYYANENAARNARHRDEIIRMVLGKNTKPWWRRLASFGR